MLILNWFVSKLQQLKFETQLVRHAQIEIEQTKAQRTLEICEH